MKDQKELPAIEDVLDALVASVDHADDAALSEWVHRYPEYERELTEFVASWTLMEWLPPSADAVTVDKETLVLRGMSILQNILSTQVPSLSGEAALLSGLVSEGRAIGLRPEQLANAVDMGLATLSKLDRRLIRFASIPRQVIDALAAALQCEAHMVKAYLQQGPIFATGAAHHAEKSPQLAQPVDFAESVRSDPDMTSAQKDHWLAFAGDDPS